MSGRKKATQVRPAGARRGRRAGRWLLAVVGAILLVAAVWVVGPSRRPAVTRAELDAYAPVTGSLTFPAGVQAAAPAARELDWFVAHRPDVEHYLPCFCGCWRVGHRGNYDCFVDEVHPDGTVLVDDMGFS